MGPFRGKFRGLSPSEFRSIGKARSRKTGSKPTPKLNFGRSVWGLDRPGSRECVTLFRLYGRIAVLLVNA